MLEIARWVEGVHRKVDVHSLVIGNTYVHKLTREDLWKELAKRKCPGIEPHMGHMDLALQYAWWQQKKLEETVK